jgi:hypothetical protein
VFASCSIFSSSSTILTAWCSEPLSAQVTAAFATAAASVSLPLIWRRQPVIEIVVSGAVAIAPSALARRHARFLCAGSRAECAGASDQSL